MCAYVRSEVESPLPDFTYGRNKQRWLCCVSVILVVVPGHYTIASTGEGMRVLIFSSRRSLLPSNSIYIFIIYIFCDQVSGMLIVILTLPTPFLGVKLQFSCLTEFSV